MKRPKLTTTPERGGIMVTNCYYCGKSCKYSAKLKPTCLDCYKAIFEQKRRDKEAKKQAVCDWCGTGFVKEYSKQIHCSKACTTDRLNHRKRIQRAIEKNKPLPLSKCDAKQSPDCCGLFLRVQPHHTSCQDCQPLYEVV